MPLDGECRDLQSPAAVSWILRGDSFDIWAVVLILMDDLGHVLAINFVGGSEHRRFRKWVPYMENKGSHTLF